MLRRAASGVNDDINDLLELIPNYTERRPEDITKDIEALQNFVDDFFPGNIDVVTRSFNNQRLLAYLNPIDEITEDYDPPHTITEVVNYCRELGPTPENLDGIIGRLAEQWYEGGEW